MLVVAFAEAAVIGRAVITGRFEREFDDGLSFQLCADDRRRVEPTRDASREPVHPRDLFDAVMPLVRLQADKLGVHVQLAVADDLPPVLCDRTMVEQVLLNLARNAMQAMDQPGIVQRPLLLAARRAPAGARTTAHLPEWLEFCVADGGPGIAPEVAQKLFTPFFTTKREGMGLGLSLCRTVVEQHGGSLGLEPNQPQGMIFKFTLPVHAPAPSSAAD